MCVVTGMYNVYAGFSQGGEWRVGWEGGKGGNSVNELLMIFVLFAKMSSFTPASQCFG